MKLIPQEIVDKAAEEYSIDQCQNLQTIVYRKEELEDYCLNDFKAGVEFAEKEIYKYIESIVIENQGLKMNQDLSIEFGEFIQNYKEPIYNIRGLFEVFLKERNNDNTRT